MAGRRKGGATHAVYVWEDRGKQRDGMLSASVVECAKTQIKYQKNAHWLLNSIRPQPYHRVSPTGLSGGAAAWTIAVWGGYAPVHLGDKGPYVDYM